MKKIILLLAFACSLQIVSAAKGDSYYFQRAEEAYSNNEFDECLRFCQEGVSTNPRDGKCWAVIAEIYSKQRYSRYGEALEAADRALSVLPKKETYWRAFTHCIRGDVFYKIGDLKASKQAYREGVALQPDNTKFLYSLADVCVGLQEYDEALGYYQRVVDISPRMVYVYGDMAMAHYLAGNREEAQRYADLTNALSSGENCICHQVLSRLALDRGDQGLACREAAEAMFCNESWCDEADTLNRSCPNLLLAAIRYQVSKAPTSAETASTAAICCFKMRRYYECLYYLHRKMTFSTSPEDVYRDLAVVYDEVEAYDEAKRYCQLVQEKDSDSGVWLNLATIARRQGQFREAIPLFRRALQDDPTQGMLYYWIARCHMEQGDYTEAHSALDSAQVLIEEEWTVSMLQTRAWIYRLQGDEAKLAETLRQIQRQRLPEGQTDMGYMTYALRNDTAALRQAYDSLMRITPDDVDQLLTLASSYALIGDREHTVALLRRHMELGGHSLRALQPTRRYAFLRNDPEWQALLRQYETRLLEDMTALQARLGGPQTSEQSVTELPFTKEGGVCRVKCTINGLPLYFVFDTGAADVSISSVEANFMLKNGYLTNADFLGKQNYVTATGEIHEGTIINLRELRVGDMVLRDIKASVVKNQSAPLLLGQSCFQRFGTLEVDNEAQVIRFILR